MSRSSTIRFAAAAATAALVAAVAAHAAARHEHDAPTDRPAAREAAPAPRRVSMEDLHAHGGVPRGWTFRLPAGDPGRGRQAFVDLECFRCHAVRGEAFPSARVEPGHVGPELSGMGAMHPAEYFAESILLPNAVIVEGPGYTGPDGLSIMPSFTDSLTVNQWIDLVAYLKSLTSGGQEHAGHAGAREQTVGDYKIRLVYVGAGGMTHGAYALHGEEGSSGGHAPPQASGFRAGHLMAFVADRETSEPVPYLPVAATLHQGQSARTLKLSPMMDRNGFHYGAMVTLPPRGLKITLAVGPTTMQAMDGRRFKTPVSAVFEWPAP